MSDNWRVRDAAFVPPPAASITSASGRGSTSLATRLGSSASTALVVPASATTSAAAVSSTVAVPDLVPAFETCPRGSRYPGPAPAAGPTGTVVVWFRGDLRLHDHPALTHAVEEAQKVVLVYCFDPRQFGKTPFGFEKTGRYRAKFLTEAVADLRESLKSLGTDLVVRRGRPEEVLPSICRETGATRLFYHREVSYEEQQVEVAVDEALDKAHIEHKPFWANTLYHVEDLPFDIQDMPDVYTEFREAVQRDGVIRPPLPVPDNIPKLSNNLEVGEIPTLSDLGLTEPEETAHGIHWFHGGEKEALSRLGTYIAESRSLPYGRSAAVHLGADFSCKISPWLALGCVSPRKIHADLSERAAKAGQTSTYFELIWRDFFRFITQKYAYCRARKDDNLSPRVRSSRSSTAAISGKEALRSYVPL